MGDVTSKTISNINAPRCELAGQYQFTAKRGGRALASTALDRWRGTGVTFISMRFGRLSVTSSRSELTYRGELGKVLASANDASPDCYFCTGIFGQWDDVDVTRYIVEVHPLATAK